MKPYHQRRKDAYEQALADFHPDFSGCRNLVEAETILRLAREGLTSAEIALRIGKTPKAVQKFYRRYRFPSLQNLAPRKGAEQPLWAGGIKICKGYYYRRSPGHPRGFGRGNYVAEHRLVMEKKLGRYLLPEEVVDHIDGDPGNNHPDNLRVFANNAEHLRATLAGRCPNWTEEGKAALARSRLGPRRTWKGVPRTPTPDV